MRALTLLVVVLCAVPAFAQKKKEPKTMPEPVQLRYPKIIEIDPAQVTGQRNGAGGVYLYDRKTLPNKSMVRERTSFRDELYESL